MPGGERRAEDQVPDPGADAPPIANAIDEPLESSFASTSVLLGATVA